MYQCVLMIYDKALGPEHISTLATVINLSNIYFGKGKLAEAEDMYDRVLLGYEKVHGPEHTNTLETVNNLGIVYQAQGKLLEAEKMFERARTDRKREVVRAREFVHARHS